MSHTIPSIKAMLESAKDVVVDMGSQEEVQKLSAAIAAAEEELGAHIQSSTQHELLGPAFSAIKVMNEMVIVVGGTDEYRQIMMSTMVQHPLPQEYELLKKHMRSFVGQLGRVHKIQKIMKDISGFMVLVVEENG
ncbi:MAG: hypothetical protein Q9209_003850 [Squamulea sp. 1 TL-2023]